MADAALTTLLAEDSIRLDAVASASVAEVEAARRWRFMRVGKMIVRSPASPSRSASVGGIHSASTVSHPSQAAT